MQDRGMEGKGEKKRRKKVVRGRARKEREKEEFSSGSFPLSLALPTEGRKTLPSSHGSPRRTQPGCPSDALATPQRWAPSQTSHHGPCRRLPWSSAVPGISNPAHGMPALANQLLPPGILILSPASSIPVHPVASVILSRGLRGGHHHLPTPLRYSEYSTLQLPKLIC